MAEIRAQNEARLAQQEKEEAEKAALAKREQEKREAEAKAREEAEALRQAVIKQVKIQEAA